jgi:hypothetical protein
MHKSVSKLSRKTTFISKKKLDKSYESTSESSVIDSFANTKKGNKYFS